MPDPTLLGAIVPAEPPGTRAVALVVAIPRGSLARLSTVR